VTYTQCRDDIAGSLMKMLWSASQLDEQSDFEELLEAIQVLRPKWSAGSTVVAWRYMRRKAWTDARQVLDNDDPQAKRSGLHAALMAVCLFGLEDPLWHSYARAAAEQRDSTAAATIGNRLLERAMKTDLPVQTVVEPLIPAVKDAHVNGSFSLSAMWVRA
jgi:type III secretion protein HrpB1